MIFSGFVFINYGCVQLGVSELCLRVSALDSFVCMGFWRFVNCWDELTMGLRCKLSHGKANKSEIYMVATISILFSDIFVAVFDWLFWSISFSKIFWIIFNLYRWIRIMKPKTNSGKLEHSLFFF